LIGGLVLAAGAGERFGGPKQLAELAGRPLLEHVLIAMAAAPLDRLAVVLGAHADEVVAGVPLHGAAAEVCEDWREGMGASLRTGVAALAACDAIVIALGDQPLLSPEAVARVVDGRGDGALAVRATYDGVPGHPVLVEKALFGVLAEVKGDVGARTVLDDAPLRSVACDGLGRPDDVDTPAVLETLRAREAGR
jgi:CTP:molybdopterin cytidylyltransferase MocA